MSFQIIQNRRYKAMRYSSSYSNDISSAESTQNQTDDSRSKGSQTRQDKPQDEPVVRGSRAGASSKPTRSADGAPDLFRQGWLNVIEDMERFLPQIQNTALKKHFKALLSLTKSTLKALGISKDRDAPANATPEDYETLSGDDAIADQTSDYKIF